MSFVKNLAEDEINKTDNPAILFRGNNAPPRILTTFIHSQAGSYLNDTLGALLRDVIQDPRVQEFSVASTIPTEEREQNLRHIQTIAKNFLDAIVDSTGSFPPYASFIYKADTQAPERSLPSHRGVHGEKIPRKCDCTSHWSWKYCLPSVYRTGYFDPNVLDPVEWRTCSWSQAGIGTGHQSYSKSC